MAPCGRPPLPQSRSPGARPCPRARALALERRPPLCLGSLAVAPGPCPLLRFLPSLSLPRSQQSLALLPPRPPVCCPAPWPALPGGLPLSQSRGLDSVALLARLHPGPALPGPSGCPPRRPLTGALLPRLFALLQREACSCRPHTHGAPVGGTHPRDGCPPGLRLLSLTCRPLPFLGPGAAWAYMWDQ